MSVVPIWAAVAVVLFASTPEDSDAVVLFASTAEGSGYLTGAPVPDWLGLATADGRDAVVLGEGCETAVAGMNVVLLDFDHVQVVDPLAGPQPGACSFVRRLRMSDMPCARNPSGLCDVAFE
jgi:hypothetical protein